MPRESRPLMRGQSAAQEPMVPPQAKPDTSQFIPTNDNELIFGPTDRPQEPVTFGTGAAKLKHLPPNFSQTMRTLVQASKDPDAPPSLRNLVTLLSHLAQE